MRNQTGATAHSSTLYYWLVLPEHRAEQNPPISGWQDQSSCSVNMMCLYCTIHSYNSRCYVIQYWWFLREYQDGFTQQEWGTELATVRIHKAGRRENGNSEVCFPSDSMMSGFRVNFLAITLVSCWSEDGYCSPEASSPISINQLYPFAWPETPLPRLSPLPCGEGGRSIWCCRSFQSRPTPIITQVLVSSTGLDVVFLSCTHINLSNTYQTLLCKIILVTLYFL